MKSPLAAALLLAVTSSPVLAAGASNTGETAYLQNGGLTYETFEVSVDHADLEVCPDEFDNDAQFCRLTLANEQAHVFVFSYEDDQPLVAVKSYDLSDGVLSF